MAKTAYPSIDAYLARQPPASRAVLKQVRDVLRTALPLAEEVISYQMPALRLHGRVVIYFAGWKGHYSVYPASDALVAELGTALAPYETSKGTIRFPLSKRVPRALLARIARFNAAMAEARTAKKGSSQRSAPRRAASPVGHEKAGEPERSTPSARRSTSIRKPRPRKKGTGMSADDFRDRALSLPGAELGSHMGATDFRVGGRIFATLASVAQGFGNLMLTPEMQADFVGEQPDVFVPIAGGWGRMGMTHIRLAAANRDALDGALRAAWQLRVDRNASSRRRPRARR